MVRANLSWITEYLALGGRIAPDAMPHLAEQLGILHVVDVRQEDCDEEQVLRKAGITLLHLPTQDHCAISPDMLQVGTCWIRGHIRAGRRVFVHCEHGIGRSAMLACCVLVTLGRSPIEAMALAKTFRPVVSPSPAQLEGFLEWCKLSQAARFWVLPTFDDLANIAYRGIAR